MSELIPGAVADRPAPFSAAAIPWSELHRPMDFEEVVGQNSPALQLAAMVAANSPRNVILAGPSGTGKTTLAEIYARALFCTIPKPSGSPCGQCEQCKIFAANRQVNFYRINCALHGDKDEIVHLLDTCMKDSAIYGKQHVALLDEAHQLSAAARDALLVPLERYGASRIFIFALIDAEALPEQLRTRCRELRLEPPSLDEGRQYLSRLCDRQGLRFEPKALRLIASFGKGFRNLAQSLEKLASASGGLITVELVRKVLLADRSTRIVDYCEALFRSDLNAQLLAWKTSQLGPVENVEMLQQLFNHLKKYFIGPSIVPQPENGCSLLFSIADCQRLLKGFDERAKALKTDLVRLFDEILEYWAFMPLRVTDSVFENLLIRFHDVLTLERKAHVPWVESKAGKIVTKAESGFRSNRKLRHRPEWRATTADTANTAKGHLKPRQAAGIYEASTFMMQEYGLTFNGSITVDHERLGIVQESQAAELISAIARELALRWADWNLEGEQHAGRGLHRICFHERRREGGLISRIILHIPVALEVKVRSWLGGFLKRWLGHRPDPDAVKFNIEHLSNVRGQIARHWELVRETWSGVSEEWQIRGRVFADLLAVPQRKRHPIGALTIRRYNLSQSIGEKAQRAAQQGGMPHLSALRDGAWDKMFVGWELKEHETRVKLAKERRRYLAGLEEGLRASGDPLHQRSISLLIENEGKNWNPDPQSWARNWVGWWQQDAS